MLDFLEDRMPKEAGDVCVYCGANDWRELKQMSVVVGWRCNWCDGWKKRHEVIE